MYKGYRVTNVISLYFVLICLHTSGTLIDLTYNKNKGLPLWAERHTPFVLTNREPVSDRSEKSSQL